VLPGGDDSRLIGGDQRGPIRRGHVDGSGRFLDDLLGWLPLGHALSSPETGVPKRWRLLRGAVDGVPEPPTSGYFQCIRPVQGPPTFAPGPAGGLRDGTARRVIAPEGQVRGRGGRDSGPGCPGRSDRALAEAGQGPTSSTDPGLRRSRGSSGG